MRPEASSNHPRGAGLPRRHFDLLHIQTPFIAHHVGLKLARMLGIAGEGPARKDLMATARRLGLDAHVRFVSYLPRGPALWDCFCAGDAFVFASSTDTQGLVLLEAMALGVPLVSTSAMGTRDIVGPGKGVLVAEESVAAFSENVVKLLQDPLLRDRLGREARQYAGQWSADSMARRMAVFYDEVIETARQVVSV